MGRREVIFEIRYVAKMPKGCTEALIPQGMATPYGTCLGITAEGGTPCPETTTGQTALRLAVPGTHLDITLRFDDSLPATYPAAMFTPHPSRFTRFADDLVAEAKAVAGDLDGLDRAIAIACATAERFTYGHPEETFNQGLDAVPALGCGLVQGSCVDINTYFIAALRAAGIEAGYATGFFFPAEKGDHCEDGHCWVVTRIDGKTQEWDIAHHLKLGTRQIKPGLNPKPGFRAACFHSMGLAFPDLGITALKALIEPLPLHPDGVKFDAPEIRLIHPGIPAAAA